MASAWVALNLDCNFMESPIASACPSALRLELSRHVEAVTAASSALKDSPERAGWPRTLLLMLAAQRKPGNPARPTHSAKTRRVLFWLRVTKRPWLTVGFQVGLTAIAPRPAGSTTPALSVDPAAAASPLRRPPTRTKSASPPVPRRGRSQIAAAGTAVKLSAVRMCAFQRRSLNRKIAIAPPAPKSKRSPAALLTS